MTASISPFWQKIIAIALSFGLILNGTATILAQQPTRQYNATPNAAIHKHQGNRYSPNEIVESGHRFFGSTSGGLATAIENIFSRYGLPSGYILGEEGSGAFIGGITYGEGRLYTKDTDSYKIFWQGPSIGWDFGGQGSRLMMLVYNLNSINNLWGRYGGISGAAYAIAGVGFNVLQRDNMLLVPIRTGIGARLGVNFGYLKLTPQATWNPF